MNNERSTAAAADPDLVPERFLCKSKLRGISIGLNVVCRVARIRSNPEARAMIWTVNYARYRGITADALADEFDLDKAYIRSCLTDPDADLARFVAHVAIVRDRFESALVEPVATKPVVVVRAAFDCALNEHALVESIGNTRMGKTKAGALPLYLRNLDRCVWLDCPSDDNKRTFLWELGAALGVGGGINKEVGLVRSQVAAVFATGMIDLLIVDEGHYLWPNCIKAKPERLEFLRCEVHRDGKVGVLVIATPQFAESMQLALAENERWAPGQWDGRVIRYHLPETMTDADLEAVARHHAPDFSAAMIAGLVAQAKACSGFAGLMVNTIIRARLDAKIAGESTITMERLMEAQKQMARGTRIEALAKTHAARSKPAARPPVRDLAPPTLNGATRRF